jgi:hypothetical protein
MTIAIPAKRNIPLSYPVFFVLLEIQKQSRYMRTIVSFLFAAAFAAGDLCAWRRTVPAVALSGALGACLAAPVLFPQIELWLLNVRSLSAHAPSAGWAAGAVSLLAAVHPWMLGTFRTLDLGRTVGLGGAGFHLFVGPSALLLGACGWMTMPSLRSRPAARTAIGL